MGKARTVEEYEEELAELRQRLLDMSKRVEQMISDATYALIEDDVELAEETIERDEQVNRDEMETDDLCLTILAKRQPMAGDLRFLTVALKMVTDLERIGDLAVNICLQTLDQQEFEDTPPLGDIPVMAELVQTMVGDAIQAFIDKDPIAARDVISRDDEVDEHYDVANRRLIERMRDGEHNIEASTGIQSVAKHLERMADHTTNLAEDVIFMVEGEDVRHRDKLDNGWKRRSSSE